MGPATDSAAALRALLAANRLAVEQVLRRYEAFNPRVFGSVARGDAHPGSDVDLLVDLRTDAGNELLRIAGLSEELTRLLRVRVDVVSDTLLRESVSVRAHQDSVAL